MNKLLLAIYSSTATRLRSKAQGWRAEGVKKLMNCGCSTDISWENRGVLSGKVHFSHLRSAYPG